jgi:uncharacterized protein
MTGPTVLESALRVDLNERQLPQPLVEKERIDSIDVLRGFALLGILPMNIQAFSMIRAAYWNSTASGEPKGADFYIWLFSHLLIDQKFITIFSMLFGAGILLMTGRVEAAGRIPAALHYRRMGWLIGIGLAHSYLLWSGDILVAYGLCGLVVFLGRHLRPRTLLVLAILFIAAGSSSLLTYGMWPALQSFLGQTFAWMPRPLSASAEVAAYRGSWLAQMPARIQTSIQAETFSFVILTFWQVTGLMLAGMAFLKLGVLHAKLPRRVYWSMIAVAVCIGIPVTLYGTLYTFTSDWNSLYAFAVGTQFNYWASLLVSLGWIGAIMLASRNPALLPFTRVLAAVGRMALTNYLMQSLICSTIFYGHGLGLFGRVERVGQLAIVFVVWAFQIAFSSIWLKRFLFGPAEWLWRSLTYLQWEPLRRNSESAA